MRHLGTGRGFCTGTAVLAAALVLLLLSGCAAQKPAVTDGAAQASTPSADDSAAIDTPPALEPLAVGDDDPFDPLLDDDPLMDGELATAAHDELDVELPELSAEQLQMELELLAVQPPPPLDFPLVINDKVVTWIDYYSKRNPKSLQAGMERSGRYLDMFRQIFAEAGIPQDLVYMAHVESLFKTSAYSRAHAKGIFQFISATGRRYGLRIDYWVDERSDPEKSARAATAYLTDLYDEFGDWYLALAGYNAGEGKVRKAVSRTGSHDFWHIAETRYLRRETKNYVPAILAATLIYKNPDKYGAGYSPDAPLVQETIEIEGAADLRVLAKCAGSDYDTLRELNPHLRRHQTPPDGKTAVHVPPGTGEQALVALREIPINERVLYARHKVRRGETLSVIARNYGTSVTAIQSSNGMGRRTMIRIDQVLKIPSTAASVYDGGAPADFVAGDPITYRVRRGDNLSAIASRYGTTAPAIAAASGISVRKTLQIGERLTVVPGIRSTSAARSATNRSTSTSSASTASADGTVSYKVRRGDTLYAIARSYSTTPAAIAAATGISVHKTLQIGEPLTVIPGARSTTQARLVARGGATVASAGGGSTVTHTVRRGDTLWDIAAAYGTTIENLCATNRISRHTTLYPGVKLTVDTP